MPISQGNRSFKIKIKELRSKINEVKKAEEEAIAELKGDLSLQEMIRMRQLLLIIKLS